MNVKKRYILAENTE